MTVELTNAVCRLPGCGGPASGVCINQLAFDECPDVIAVEDAEEVEAPPAAGGQETVSTGRTGVLSIEEADAFLRSQGGLMLAVVAGPDAGKTTLAATIYDLVRRGRLDGFGFAGTETVKGFEERCFDSRVASGQDEASTLRTPRGAPLVFVHLRIAVPDGRHFNFLLSDRSGEHFERALDAPSRFAGFPEISRADAILLLVDSGKLVSGHQAEIAHMRKLILAIAHAGFLSGKAVHLVVTKVDRLRNEAQRTLVEQRAGVIADEVRRRGNDSLVEVHLTACRARRGSSTFGEGIHRLLEANVPAIRERPFATKSWTPGDGGTPLDRLLHVPRWI